MFRKIKNRKSLLLMLLPKVRRKQNESVQSLQGFFRAENTHLLLFMVTSAQERQHLHAVFAPFHHPLTVYARPPLQL